MSGDLESCAKANLDCSRSVSFTYYPPGQQTFNSEKPKSSGPSFMPTVPTVPNFKAASQNITPTVPNLSRAQKPSSPSPYIAPYANQKGQQQPKTLNIQQPMAASIISQDRDPYQPSSPSETRPNTRPPATESYIAREKERIALLLDLNRDLLWDLKTRQENGEAGSLPPSADQGDDDPTNIKLEKQPSQEYSESVSQGRK